MQHNLSAAATLLVAACFCAPAAQAQFRSVGPGVADRTGTVARSDGQDNWLVGGEFQTNFQGDGFARSSALGAYGNVFNESLLNVYVLAPYGFSLNFVGRFEGAEREPTGATRIFADVAAWLDELNLTWSRGALDLYGGKIHPRFGSAWDRGPGLYGTDFGQGYEIEGRIGAGARLWWSDLIGLTGAAGVHNAQVDIFQADTSVLSQGVFNRRWTTTQTRVDPDTGETYERARFTWRNTRATGGLDNRDDLSGLVASFAGFGIPLPVGQAGYTISYSNRRAGQDAALANLAAVEQGVTVGGFATIPLPARMVLAPFVEVADLTNAQGFDGRRVQVLTAGADLRRAPWTLSATWQGAKTNDRIDGRTTASEPTVSLTYDLYFLAPLPILRGASLTAGWRQIDDGSTTTNGYGGSLTWAYKF